MSCLISSADSSEPRVRLLQWVANSFLLMCIAMSSSATRHILEAESSVRLALSSRSESSGSHSNTHPDSWAIKVPYSAWDSEKQATVKRCMKCQMSSLTAMSVNRSNCCPTLDAQQSRSTYNTFGGGACDCSYRNINPSAISSRPSPSESVRTDITTWPNLLPTLVHQDAVALALPANVLVT